MFLKVDELSFGAITKTRLLKNIENCTTNKIENFQMKNSDSFHISV